MFTSFAQQEVLSPLKQKWSSGEITQIQCNNGFQLIGKKENGSPACVTQDTFSKLIAHGWGYDPIHQWSIIGLNDTYKMGQKIDFNVEYRGMISCCIYYAVIIEKSNGTPIWQTHFSNSCSCPAMPVSPRYTVFDETMTNLTNMFGVLSINETGKYIVSVNNVSKNFTVIP